jgi:hypothetical protein
MTTLSLDLGLPAGLWRAQWFGTLERFPSSARELGVYTFFDLVSPSQEFPGETQERVLVSMSHMHLLPLGTLVSGEDGRIMNRRDCNGLALLQELTVDLSRDRTEILPRSRLDLPGPRTPWFGTPQYDALVLRVSATGSSPEVIIPCSVLFQFYWGVSSTMANAVLAGKFEDLGRYIFNPDGTLFQDRHFSFEVRRQWMDSEVPYLATIASDPDALEACRGVLRSIILQEQMRQSGQPLRLEVWPPFPRITTIVADVHKAFQADGGASRLLVMRIHSADLAPKWNTLSFTSENDSRKAIGDDQCGQSKPPEGSSPAESPPLFSAPSHVGIAELPAGHRLDGSELRVLDSLANRFPGLEEMDVQKAPKEAGEQHEPRQKPRQRSGPWSAILGAPNRQTDVLQGKLVGDPEREPPKPDVEDQDLAVKTVDPDLADFASLFSKGDFDVVLDNERTSVAVTFLDLGHKARASRQIQYFELPTEVDGEELTWLYRDPEKKQPKRAICVALEATSKSGRKSQRFVLDFERRFPKKRVGSVPSQPMKNSFVVVWIEGVADPQTTVAMLHLVVQAVARNRNPLLTYKVHEAVNIRALRHAKSTPERLIKRVLGATDQMNRDKDPVELEA